MVVSFDNTVRWTLVWPSMVELWPEGVSALPSLHNKDMEFSFLTAVIVVIPLRT